MCDVWVDVEDNEASGSLAIYVDSRLAFSDQTRLWKLTGLQERDGTVLLSELNNKAKWM